MFYVCEWVCVVSVPAFVTYVASRAKRVAGDRMIDASIMH
jgi:hypothetical protein